MTTKRKKHRRRRLGLCFDYDDDASNDAPASAGVLVVRASRLLQGVDGLLETIRDLSVVELVAPEANVGLK